MDTNRIKKFAIEARHILKRGIAAKITTLGFDARGNVPKSQIPQLMQGGTLWNGQLETESFYHQWMSLYHRVQTKGISEVYEEAAYTWFNRLMAIRILQKNGLCEPVMEYADASRTPRIVNEARMGNLPQMPEEVRLRLMDLLDDDTKVTEQFAVLVTAWCHQNPIIQNCFGGIKDYTELLLPRDILSEGGFVDMINHTEFITDEDYSSAELIGWLYQFYISERKDEVFAKKGKFNADEIPAATQIFTPNWIVKYMVQNTVGRIYLDNNPYAEEEFIPQWKYLVEPSEHTPNEAIYHYDELTDLKVADLACGSGHILNECFDLLYNLYISEAYSRSEAIENIFKFNLTGVDLDNRAKQMAQFALLIKACQKDNRFADAHCMPNILTMPEKLDEQSDISTSELLNSVTLGLATPDMIEETSACYNLLQDSDSLGSIMKFSISDSTRLMLLQTVKHWESQSIVPSDFYNEIAKFKLILALTENYSALVMNPPYMGSGNMNDVLLKYVKKYYVDGKTDLFAVFMLLAIKRLDANGKYGMINMHSWMFITSYTALREYLVKNYRIDSLLHLGPRTFNELSGEVVQNAAFVITKTKSNSNGGTYYRLVEPKSCEEKHKEFFNPANKFINVNQDRFLGISGSPIGYWVSDQMYNLLSDKTSIGESYDFREGIHTADNNRFVHFWFECNFHKFVKNASSYSDVDRNGTWVPYNKGGEYRKWYGNNDYTIAFDASNRGAMEQLKGHVRPSQGLYFKEGATWTAVSMGKFGIRYYPKGFLFDAGGQVAVGNNIYSCIGFLNSVLFQYIAKLTMPTMNFKCGVIKNLPDLRINNSQIDDIVKRCIKVSQQDWDAHEKSWNFKRPDIISLDTDQYIDNINWQIEEHYKNTGEHICLDAAAPEFDSLEWCYTQYCYKWKRLFLQLHTDEEELNNQFITYYGLQDELSPEVPMKEITILQEGEIKIYDDNEIKFNGNVLMKQLISYAVGIWMGRYKLDKTDVYIAHPEASAIELAPYTFKDETVYIDDDGIIPILPSGCPFDDNLPSRVADFIRIVFGEERLTENLNFMEQQLGTTIEQYLLKDFWKDHKKMYQNRPIYWLFSSKKGAFKCLAYMHRMTPYTAERVRAKYLLPYIEKLNQQINDFMNHAASLSTAERRQMENLKKTLEECNEYHDRLQVLAEDTERTSFDLDDGVLVNYAKYGDVLAKLK